MRSCDLIGGLGRLQRSAATLREHWLQTKTHWQDQASRDFEKNFLQDLAPQITLVMAAVHEFAEQLERAEKELIDRDRSE